MYKGVERRAHTELSQREVELISDRVAEVIINRLYAHIGKSILRKLYWCTGIIVVSVTYYLNSKGIFKWPG